MLTKLKLINIVVATSALCGAVAGAHAQQVYRCNINGKTVYQQEPCEKTGGKGREVNVEPAVIAPAPANTKAPVKVEKAEKAEKTEKAEKSDKAQKSEKAEKSEKSSATAPGSMVPSPAAKPASNTDS